MKKMAAGSFKANCLAVMDEVAANHEGVIITKYGKPVAKLVPVQEDGKPGLPSIALAPEATAWRFPT